MQVETKETITKAMLKSETEADGLKDSFPCRVT